MKIFFWKSFRFLFISPTFLQKFNGPYIIILSVSDRYFSREILISNGTHTHSHTYQFYYLLYKLSSSFCLQKEKKNYFCRQWNLYCSLLKSNGEIFYIILEISKTFNIPLLNLYSCFLEEKKKQNARCYFEMRKKSNKSMFYYISLPILYLV